MDLRKGAGLLLLQFQRGGAATCAFRPPSSKRSRGREVQAFVPALKHAKLVRSAVTRNPEATWLPRIGAKRTSQPNVAPSDRDRRLVDATPAGPTRWNRPSAAASPQRKCSSRRIAGVLASEGSNFVGRDRMSSSKLRSPESSGAIRPGSALKRAVEWLLQTQSTEGWWSGELETNVTMTAEHVLLFRFLGFTARRSALGRDRAHPAQSARGRIVGALLRRASRSQHDDRGLRGAEGARRRPRAASRCARRWR